MSVDAINDDVKRDAAFNDFWQNTALPKMQDHPIAMRFSGPIKQAAQEDWNAAWLACKTASIQFM